jgi:hypothetical protein
MERVMTASWTARRPDRPDPYLDWEYLNTQVARNGKAHSERWCSVLIQVLPGPPSDLAKNLKRLSAVVTGQPPDGPFAIKMNADEAALLEKRVRQPADAQKSTPDPEDVELQYFIYLPENLAYSDGNYADTDYYRIRFVGPPIKGLVFNSRTIREPRAGIQGFERRSGSVAIGIIDDGLAFAHERFRKRVGAGREPDQEDTRVEHLWLQDLERAPDLPDEGVAFGRRLDSEEINKTFKKLAGATGLIDDRAVYRSLGLLDFAKQRRVPMAFRHAHGTHVMDLACGFAPNDAAGLARPIFAVQLPEEATADTSGLAMGSYVLQGLRQIMLWADGTEPNKALPLVVNFSYGFYAGPKDGSHVLEREIDRLVAHRNKSAPTAVVLPAGNSFKLRTTAKIVIAPNKTTELDWMLQPDSRTDSFLELWLDREDDRPVHEILQLILTLPNGSSGPSTLSLNSEAAVLNVGGKPIAAVYVHTTHTTRGHRTRILLAANPTNCRETETAAAPSGRWALAFSNISNQDLKLDLTIQRSDTLTGFRPRGRQSFFEHANAFERDPATGNYDSIVSAVGLCPITHANTLSAIGNGEETILVGATRDAGIAVPAGYTASGPTKARSGPDFAAPGDQGPSFPGIIAAATLSGTVVAMRGTSVAAPQVARRLADAGVNFAELQRQCLAADAIDPQLGGCIMPLEQRPDVPARKR